MSKFLAALTALDQVLKELVPLLLLICVPYFGSLACIADAACVLAGDS